MRPSDSLKLVRNSHPGLLPESRSEVEDCVPTVGHAVYFMGDLILKSLWCCCCLQDYSPLKHTSIVSMTAAVLEKAIHQNVYLSRDASYISGFIRTFEFPKVIFRIVCGLHRFTGSRWSSSPLYQPLICSVNCVRGRLEISYSPDAMAS